MQDWQRQASTNRAGSTGIAKTRRVEMFNKARIFAAAGLIAILASPAPGETNKINASKQYGLSYLPLMIMEDQKLVEKHAAAAGLKDMTVQWVTL